MNECSPKKKRNIQRLPVNLFIRILAWEPSVALVTHSNSRRLPALGRFYRETIFLLLKSICST